MRPPLPGQAHARRQKPLRSAPANVSSMPSTSPVDFISGPRIVSTPRIFENEKTGTLTTTYGTCGMQPGAVRHVAQLLAERDARRGGDEVDAGGLLR